MPCVYCNTIKSPNRNNHTLTTCVESADEVIGPIVMCFTEYPCNIILQKDELSKYSHGQLAMACKQLKTHFSGTKQFLIGAMIRQMFRNQVLSNISSLTSEDLYAFDNSYNLIYAIPACELRTSLINIMESLYLRIFGRRRDGNRDGSMDYGNLRAIQMGYSLHGGYSLHDIYTLHRRASPPLSIKVNVNPSINEIKECDVCYGEKKPTAKLGCSHEFCVECVSQLCKLTQNTFISCPMCRADVSNIQVGNQEMCQSLNSQISLRC